MTVNKKQLSSDNLHRIMKPFIKKAFDIFINKNTNNKSKINELFSDVNFTIGGIDIKNDDLYKIIFYIAGKDSEDALVFFIGFINKYSGEVKNCDVIYPPKAMGLLFPED